MILAKLKQRTQKYHNEVEHSMDIFNKNVSLEEYERLLQRLLGFYFPIETKIDCIKAKDTIPFDFTSRNKTFLLVNDLKALGMLDTSWQTRQICTDLPMLENISQVLGCMYVLEGATLGGQIISKRVRRLFAFAEGHGYTFFSSYGRDVGIMWKSFCDMLAAYSSAENAEEVIISSACETFIQLNSWLLEGDGR